MLQSRYKQPLQAFLTDTLQQTCDSSPLETGARGLQVQGQAVNLMRTCFKVKKKKDWECSSLVGKHHGSICSIFQ